MADYSAEQRRAAEAQGHALPPLEEGGEPRYPINNCQDVKNAIRDLGRTAPSERPRVRAYIARRASELGCDLPDSWRFKRRS
jgi:hypothetical protein